MALEKFTQPFYSSRAWKSCRDAYIRSVGGLCERCKKNGVITAGAEVHHKIRLTPANVNDPKIALSWSNLELLCADCHHAVHRAGHGKRWTCDASGRVTATDNPPISEV